MKLTQMQLLLEQLLLLLLLLLLLPLVLLLFLRQFHEMQQQKKKQQQQLQQLLHLCQFHFTFNFIFETTVNFEGRGTLPIPMHQIRFGPHLLAQLHPVRLSLLRHIIRLPLFIFRPIE